MDQPCYEDAELIDERAQPSLRARIGELLADATHADFAVGHVRLCAIDLDPSEIGSMESCRLLIGRLDVDMLSETADLFPRGGDLSQNLATLLRFIDSGRLDVRSTASACWWPDFSVFRGHDNLSGVALVGAHYFSRPVMLDGASLTACLRSNNAVATASRRFDELWLRGYDVLPAIREFLRATLAWD